ncbi:hypothetical protein [Salinispora arenicola]|uniref:hypothetical protein n=1 Tax=Salinispora arenicola TaxID=168697 RepID=UPI00037AFF6F|nr:hypothetical protein [Salinispora arenicola]
MNKAETALILAAAAARDLRTVGDADVLAWHEDLGDITYPEAREALRRHYRDSTDRIMPAHIRHHTRTIRDEHRRQVAHQVRALPSRYEDDTTRDARAARGAELCRQAIAAALGGTADEEPPAPLTPSDEIRQRALDRARAERKTTGQVPGMSSAGDVLNQIIRRKSV